MGTIENTAYCSISTIACETVNNAVIVVTFRLLGNW